MVSSKRIPTGQMALLLSRSVLSPVETPSTTISKSLDKLVSAMKSSSFTRSLEVIAGTYWYHSHLSTQYCDGLRGPLVVYDPHDPHAHRYDVDDGMSYSHV